MQLWNYRKYPNNNNSISIGSVKLNLEEKVWKWSIFFRENMEKKNCSPIRLKLCYIIYFAVLSTSYNVAVLIYICCKNSHHINYRANILIAILLSCEVPLIYGRTTNQNLTLRKIKMKQSSRIFGNYFWFYINRRNFIWEIQSIDVWRTSLWIWSSLKSKKSWSTMI